MALSARFSPSPFFAHLAPNYRGEQFAKEAQSLYAKSTGAQGDEIPSLEFLQGCILLAFYHNTICSNSFGWILTGVCTRLAYDLGIHHLDDDVAYQVDSTDQQWTSVEEWSAREELRRAWWAVWELDTFASTVARRPYTIDRNTMHVLLPVSDDRWFSDQPMPSALIRTTPAAAWRSLDGCPNQDARAWFLVANFLMALAYNLRVQKEVTIEAKTEMQNALTCFALSLPADFRLVPGVFVFNNDTFARSNWIIATNIILQR